MNAKVFSQQEEDEESSEENTPVESQIIREQNNVRLLLSSIEQRIARLEGKIQNEQIKIKQVQLEQTKVSIQNLETKLASSTGAERIEIEQQLHQLKEVKNQLESEISATTSKTSTPPPPPPTSGPTTEPPSTDPGTPPSTGTTPDTITDFVYDTETDKLSIPASKTSNLHSTTQYLEGIEITEAKLRAKGVEETTSMAIPILREVIKDPTQTTSGNYFNAALSDITRIAGQILTDVTLSGSIPTERVWNADKLLDQLGSNPYTFELAKLLAKKGAIGEKSDPNSNYPNIENLANDIISLVGGREKLNNVSSLKDLVAGEVSEAGTGINTHLLGARKFTINEKDADLFNIKLENVSAALGSNIMIEGGEIDVSQHLTKAKDSGDRKIFAIAAAKDLTIKDSITFKNDNKVEDHALAIGAADDVHFRSGSLNDYLDETFMAKYLDPDGPVFTKEQDVQPTSHPSHLDLTYEGSNLGLGSYDTLDMVNVNITTGGNLGIGTLKELKILSTDPAKPSRITVGQYSDSDNAYLYAQERIAINGLAFGGRVNEVYMEAATIDLKNVAFPSNSEVLLRSRDGRATFGESNRALGSVNFIKNVSHGGTTLEPNHFSGPDGHVNSSITVNGGVPAVRVRGFSAANK